MSFLAGWTSACQGTLQRCFLANLHTRYASNSSAALVKKATKKVKPLVTIHRSAEGAWKTFKPITPGLRHLRQPLNDHLYKGDPIRILTVAKRKKSGRNHHGHITVRGRGGGHRQRIRILDFYRHEPGLQKVVRIEYDPGRSGHIALIQHAVSGDVSYIIAPDGLREGDTVESFRSGLPDSFKVGAQFGGSSVGDYARPESPQTVYPPEPDHEMGAEGQPGGDSPFEVPGSSTSGVTPDFNTVFGVPGAKTSDIDGSSLSATSASNTAATGDSEDDAIDIGAVRAYAIKTGNVLPLRYIPAGIPIHAICLKEHGKGVLARSAGSSSEVVTNVAGPGGKFAQVRMASGEIRLIKSDCCATVGTVSNRNHNLTRLGKAGRARWLGRRPKVRGVAQNRVDHPHGGGRGKSKGNKHPRSPTGVLKFSRTRRPGGKNGNQFVVKQRPRGKERLQSNR